jgi:hypothetical protein
MPTLILRSTSLGREVPLSMMEDNEAMIKVCLWGKNPTMRYLNRTHKVDIAWLMEVFELPKIKLFKVNTKPQAADIGTTRITCVDTWQPNCVLINLIVPGLSANFFSHFVKK